MKPAFERAKTEPMTPELFEAMCREHDLTYKYSDDGRAYNAGVLEYKALASAVSSLMKTHPGLSMNIWNKVVCEKILPEGRGEYLL